MVYDYEKKKLSGFSNKGPTVIFTSWEKIGRSHFSLLWIEINTNYFEKKSTRENSSNSGYVGIDAVRIKILKRDGDR